MELLKGWSFQEERIHFLLESSSFLRGRWAGAVRKGFLDKRLPLGHRFIAPIHTEVHGKPYGTTDLMTRDGMVRERRRLVAMSVMAIDVVDQTAHLLAQGVSEDQRGVGLRAAHRFRLLERIREPTVIDAVLEPRRFSEEAGEGGFVGALQHTAGDVGQTFIVQDDQTCQVILEVVKLAPILKEIAKDVRVGGHDGSRSYNGKLHETFALSPRGWDRASVYRINARNGKIQQSTENSTLLDVP